MKSAIIVICAVLLVLLVLLFLLCGYIFNQTIWRKTIPLPAFIVKLVAGTGTSNKKYELDGAKAEEYFRSLEPEDVTLEASDGAKLRGCVIIPPKSNGKLILACHGARSSGIGEFRFISRYFYENGYTVVMPDHRGCGKSDGKYMGYGTHESKDTFLWLEYARERFADLDVFLYGVSMGAATVMMMSNQIQDDAVKGIIADCGYTSAWDEFSYHLKNSFHVTQFPILHICSLYCRILCGYSFKDASPLSAVKQSKRPILFIHGDKDDFVPFYMEKILYDACSSKKDILVIHGAAHARSYYVNSQEYEKKFEAFIDECTPMNLKQ